MLYAARYNTGIIHNVACQINKTIYIYYKYVRTNRWYLLHSFEGIHTYMFNVYIILFYDDKYYNIIIRHSRSWQTPKSNNHLVSLSRSKVYSSHTLSTFLTLLNQKWRSSVTYSCRHFWIFSSKILVSVSYSCHTMFTHINGYLNMVGYSRLYCMPRGYATPRGRTITPHHHSHTAVRPLEIYLYYY